MPRLCAAMAIAINTEDVFDIANEVLTNVPPYSTEMRERVYLILSDYYDDILLDFDTADAKKTGLGFSDLRIKSDRPLKYKFLPVGDNEQFYLLQTSVKTKK